MKRRQFLLLSALASGVSAVNPAWAQFNLGRMLDAGIEVCLCGELAADPFCIPVLMGMQVDSISLGPHAIPGIKRIVRQTSMEE